jgi:hypothetical protein
MFDYAKAYDEDFFKIKKNEKGEARIQLGRDEIIMGDYDFRVAMDLSQRELVEMYKENGDSAIFDLSDTKYEKNFRATNSIIGCDRKEFGKSVPADDKYDSDVLEDALKSRKQYTSSKIEEIEALFQNVYEHFPKHLKHTVNNCYAVCVSLLQNDLNYVTGLKTANILKNALMKAEQMYGEHSSAGIDYTNMRSLSRCFQHISRIFTSVRQMDTYTLDTSQYGIVGPLVKLYFSTERKISEAFSALNKELTFEDGTESKNKLELFLTVGISNTFRSEEYFYEQIRKGKERVRLISFNLPSAELITNFTPYMIHEIGHRINRDDTKEKRNKCLYMLFKNYSKVYLDRHPNAVPPRHRKGFIDRMENHIRGNGSNNGSDAYSEGNKYWYGPYTNGDDCVERWKKGMTSFFHLLGLDSGWDIYNLLHGGYFEMLNEVAFECYADFIMVKYLHFDFNAYIGTLYRYFDENKITIGNEAAFILRLTAIAYYFFLKDNVAVNNEFIVWHLNNVHANNEYRSLLSGYDKDSNYKENMIKYNSLVKPITDYLMDLDENWEDTLSPHNDGSINAGEIEECINLWFKYVREIRFPKRE